MSSVVLPLCRSLPFVGTGELRARRGVTLVEILIVLAIVAVISGITVVGFGGVASTRLKRGATQVAGATRIAYAHATATSKVTRLVFDFEERKIILEEADSAHLVRRDQAGGAEASTEIEQQAIAASENVVSGPRRGRAAFSPVKAIGFPAEGRDLPSGISFWQVEAEHQDAPLAEGRAYLYFFPGGQTENASVVLRIANSDDDDPSGFMSVLVAPLTGKASIHKGKIEMPKPRDDREASEREDSGP